MAFRFVAKTLALVSLSMLFAPTTWAVGGRESMDRPSARPLPLPQYPPPSPGQDITLPPVPGAKIPIGDGRKISIRRILLEGNTVFPEQDLKVMTQSYENRKVSVAELEELRQRLSQYYIDHGYVNSGAIIPADALKDNELRIQIIEGHLDEIRVNGQGRLREGYIKNRLQGEAEKPLNLNELQDRFQTLLSDPLISRMNGRILPGSSPGLAILDVDVTRARPYHLTLFGDNYRPPSIGSEAFGLNAWVRNLTGFGDVLDFTFIQSAGSSRYQGGFSVPVTDWGTVVFFHFDEGDSSVIEEPLEKLDIKSQVHSLEGGISHLVINKLRQRLNLGIMLAVRENESSLLGESFSFIPGESTGRNQATVLRLFQEGMWRWERQALAFRSTFSVGMTALGATPKTSDKLPSSDFFSWLGQAQYAYRLLDNGTQIILRGNSQFSDAPLLPLEQIAIGGVFTVRGYRENHLVRDNGYNLSLEFHYPIIGGNDPQARHRLTLIPFMDYGEAWNNYEIFKGVQKTLYSMGIGFNWQLGPVSSDFFYGYAFNRPEPHTTGDPQDYGIHFQTRLDVF